MSKFLCVGYITVAIDNAGTIMSIPSAPANYKDPDKIASYVQAALAKGMEEAHLKPLTAKLLRLTTFNESGVADQSVQDMQLQAEDWRDYDFIAVIRPNFFRAVLINHLIGVYGKLPLTWRCLVASTVSGYSYLVAKDHQHPVMFDPVHAITGSTAEANNDLEAVAKRYSVQSYLSKRFDLPEDYLTGQLCYSLCVALGLEK